MFPSTDASVCSPLPSGGCRGRPLREPCGSPPSPVLWVHKTAQHPFRRLRSPLAAGTSHGEEGMKSSPGSRGNPCENMPRASDSGDPGRPRTIGRPSTAFRHTKSVGIAIRTDFGADLRGLFPCCARFAPTSRPVNGNTHFRTACSALSGRDLHPMDFIK